MIKISIDKIVRISFRKKRESPDWEYVAPVVKRGWFGREKVIPGGFRYWLDLPWESVTPAEKINTDKYIVYDNVVYDKPCVYVHTVDGKDVCKRFTSDSELQEYIDDPRLSKIEWLHL